MDLKRACDILGVGVDATPRDVRRAYLIQVRLWHPDRFVNDPSGQRRAEELLKGINEAYGFMQAEAVGRVSSPSMEHPVNRSEPPYSEPPIAPPAPGGEPSTPFEPFSLFRALPAIPIIAFFSAWQNIIFVLLVACTVSVSIQLYGTFFNGAAYLIKMLLLPFLFALCCNSVCTGKRFLWLGYGVVVSLFGIMVMLDSVRFRNELNEAGAYRYYASPDAAGTNYGGALPSAQEQGQFSFPGRRDPSGPLPPVPPEVMAPSAPLAPVAPAAPIAAPAR